MVLSLKPFFQINCFNKSVEERTLTLKKKKENKITLVVTDRVWPSLIIYMRC